MVIDPLLDGRKHLFNLCCEHVFLLHPVRDWMALEFDSPRHFLANRQPACLPAPTTPDFALASLRLAAALSFANSYPRHGAACDEPVQGVHAAISVWPTPNSISGPWILEHKNFYDL